MFIVYMLKSVSHNWHYVGMTSNLLERFKRHNSGRERATKFYFPFKLVFKKTFETRLEARDYEKYLKIRCNKEKLIYLLNV